MKLTDEQIVQGFTIAALQPPRAADVEVIKMMGGDSAALAEYFWDHWLGEPDEPTPEEIEAVVLKELGFENEPTTPRHLTLDNKRHIVSSMALMIAWTGKTPEPTDLEYVTDDPKQELFGEVDAFLQENHGLINAVARAILTFAFEIATNMVKEETDAPSAGAAADGSGGKSDAPAPDPN